MSSFGNGLNLPLDLQDYGKRSWVNSEEAEHDIFDAYSWQRAQSAHEEASCEFSLLTTHVSNSSRCFEIPHTWVIEGTGSCIYIFPRHARIIDDTRDVLGIDARKGHRNAAFVSKRVRKSCVMTVCSLEKDAKCSYSLHPSSFGI
jgi:hypothetical protein